MRFARAGPYIFLSRFSEHIAYACADLAAIRTTINHERDYWLSYLFPDDSDSALRFMSSVGTGANGL